MPATLSQYRRFDSTLLFSVDDLIAESEAAAVAEELAASEAAAAKAESRREACLECCERLAARAHSWLYGENDPVKFALFRVLDQWYALTLKTNRD